MENERGLKTNYNLNDNNGLPYKYYKAIDTLLERWGLNGFMLWSLFRSMISTEIFLKNFRKLVQVSKQFLIIIILERKNILKMFRSL